MTTSYFTFIDVDENVTAWQFHPETGKRNNITVSGASSEYQWEGDILKKNSSISGMMTARFLLHLRKWEEQGQNGTSTRLPTETIQFAPGHAGSLFDDFGEDPVYRARQQSTGTP